MSAPAVLDPARLERALHRVIEGEVRFDTGSRALYATDASNYRQVPIGIVIPRSVEDIIAAVSLAHRFQAPLLLRGGGTSLAGQTCNAALLIDTSKYLHEIIAIEPDVRRATVQPGCILDRLRSAANAHGLTFGPDPATHDHNTLGGMLGNNSCGVHSVMAGRTSDNVHSLDILTYDGLRLTVGRTDAATLDAHKAAGGRRAEIFGRLEAFQQRYGALLRTAYPRIPRRVSGYENLDMLLPENGFQVARALVGTEGSCVTILGATLDLVPEPAARVLVAVSFADVFAAADAVPEVLSHGPIGLEGMDDMLIGFLKRGQDRRGALELLPEGKGFLLVEFGADNRDEACRRARGMMRALARRARGMRLLQAEAEQAKLWALREGALGATAHVPGEPESHPGWEDSAVPREALGQYLRELKALFDHFGYKASVYGHFGDGLVHCRIPFDLRSQAGLARWQEFLDAAAALVVRHGGSLSGEHGDGQARGRLLETMYGPEMLQAFRDFKAIWDPDGRMNPGKVVTPFPETSNLRLGPDYQPPTVDTYFSYPEDDHSFARATRRCVGVGACRRRDSSKGVMCPSYMATDEEMHSTRGRARLLFEMLHGGAIDDLWRSRAVEEALDLCLACKGCKSDCPVSVDMATYKAEFRAHHYRHRLRPRAAYTMGRIHQWSSLASLMPGLANLLLDTPPFAAAAKWIAGIAPARRIPRYATTSFTRWHRRNARRDGRETVMLWPDTFNNYFRVDTAIAATRLLETLGYCVVIPAAPVCCGRPLYDWGFLDDARRLWQRTLRALEPALRAGWPIVGLEPSCVSAFKDELPHLLANDERAHRLSHQMIFLSDLLHQRWDRHPLPPVDTAIMVQHHCHHHAIIDTRAETALLRRLQPDCTVLQAGCCGMAGSFGFEQAKYPVSLRAAERALLPAVRGAADDTVILANGFSCREQIEQAAPRPTLHIAELLYQATAAASR